MALERANVTVSRREPPVISNGKDVTPKGLLFPDQIFVCRSNVYVFFRPRRFAAMALAIQEKQQAVQAIAFAETAIAIRGS